MFFYVLPFVVGILVVQQLSELPSLFWLIVLSLIAFLLSFYRYWRLFFFIIGIMWASSFSIVRLANRLPELLQGQTIEVEGQVIGLPHYDERKVRFDFSVSKPTKNFPKKIRLSWYFPKQKIKTGQFWTLAVKLKKPHGRFNPGGFDYEKWLFEQNIGATGYVRTNPEPLLNKFKSTNKTFSNLRQEISDKLDELLKDSDNKGLVKALMIGERNEINQQQWDVFRKTGTVHLLAISGLHIGLISGLVYFLVLQISIKLSTVSPQKYAAISALVFALFYSALAGFSLPTQRSLMMLIIAMIALVWQRKITASNTVSLTLFTVLIVDPLAVLSIGFWLSFLAVIVIIYSLAGRLGRRGYWLSAIKIHCVTAIGLAPLLIYSFQQISVISPIANFISVPVISFLVVPLCLLSVVFMFIFPFITEQCLTFVDTLLQGLYDILLIMADLPYAVLNTETATVFTIPLTLLAVFILMAPKGLPARWLGLVFLIPSFFVNHDKPKQGEITTTLLDVGQGLSAVIETAHHVLVFDTGAKYSNKFNMGDAVVIPFLESKGIEVVDALLISHADNDHSGGALSIIKQKKVSKILTSVPNLFEQYSPILCLRGQTWEWDQVRFEVLSPSEDYLKGENNNSCVLKVSSNYGTLLFTGDIEKPAEDWLVTNYANQLESDILIAPHHGSKTSSSVSLLQQVSPKMILIPAGYRNRFFFPHQEIIERYEKLSIPWVSTVDKGAVVVKIQHNSIIIDSIRDNQSKYWNK
ncbi:MAG: DNA internalization-related competence protein ComEC/Rec2 [Methylococcaceae bacterium]|nr:DNA internalization-related competence protein ComEC/Rec2 [Methylococcaceae bacterium]